MDLATAESAILASNLRASMSLPPIKLHSTCTHEPIPCVALRAFTNLSPSAPPNCKIQALKDQWIQRDRTYPFRDHPLAEALSAEGCDRLRARMVIDAVGYGMDVRGAKGVVDACRRLKGAMAMRGGVGGGCSSCGPGSNTAVFRGYDASMVGAGAGYCFQIPVSVENFQTAAEAEGKILCIGQGGELR